MDFRHCRPQDVVHSSTFDEAVFSTSPTDVYAYCGLPVTVHGVLFDELHSQYTLMFKQRSQP